LITTREILLYLTGKLEKEYLRAVTQCSFASFAELAVEQAVDMDRMVADFGV
jgi:hypothetical protein